MFLKYPSERKRQKKKKEHSLFRRIWWSVNRIWEPWGHFIPRSHEEPPHGYCSEGTVKAPQYPSCLSCAQAEDIWSHHHRALPPSSWNSSLCNHCETSLTFKSMHRKRSDVKLSLSWDMTYSSLLATDTVGFPCSILQYRLSAAHLTTVTFF